MGVDDGVMFEDPGGLGLPLDELFAWVTVHGPGDESIAAFVAPGRGTMPMVVQQRHAAEAMRPLARALSASVGKPMRLVRLVRVEVIEEMRP